MSDENNYTIWLFLKKCHEQGWIYKGHDVMPWCTRCGAALSEHEIAGEGYKEMTHVSITARFPLIGREREYLLVWTTTPWTLTSNTAAAVHPDLTYVKICEGENVYYLLESRLGIIKHEYQVLEKIPGKEMLGWTYHGPFDDLPLQQSVKHVVIAWNEISETEGTGIVHIAPGCGQEDFQLGKEFDLNVIAPLDEFGNYLEGFGWLTGQNVDNVLQPILKDLEKKEYKYSYDQYTHRYPICWRHKTPLVFRLVDEWFIAMDEIRPKIMEVTKQIRWIPDYGLSHELDWLRNMSDWMISKKRYWGLALPIFECSQCGHVTVIGGKEELKAKTVEGWDEFEGHSPHRPWVDLVKIRCEQCGAIVSRIQDVGNPWLDAGIVPFSTLHYTIEPSYWQEWFPADFICESLPGQFRNWFYSLLAMSTVLENKPPFKTILGYALVKDENGEDMHKSTGNAIWFDDAAEQMGVDVMRWMYADHNPLTNLNFGYGAAKEIRKQLITLWNSYSFFATYAELDQFEPFKNQVSRTALSELDLWLLARLHQLFADTNSAYEDYAVHRVMKQIDDFLEDLSNWYIRRSRRRFWKSEDDQDKWGAYQTLYQTLKGLILVLAPVVPFITESIYQNLVCGLEPDAPLSIHIERFPQADPSYINQQLLRKINTIIKIVSMGRAARNKVNIKVRQPLNRLLVKLPIDLPVDEIEAMQNQLLEELNVKCIEFVADETQFAHYILKPNLAVLGPKYSRLLGEIQKRIAELDPVISAQKLATGGTIELVLTDRKVYLTNTDLLVERQDAEHFAASFDGDYAVAVETQLTPELIREGLIRDLIRHIQMMRKDASFQVEDRILVALEPVGEMKLALEEHLDYFKTETLAQIVKTKLTSIEFEREIIIGNERVHVAICRVN
jgi:isoleucyl-tRNA synthetase